MLVIHGLAVTGWLAYRCVAGEQGRQARIAKGGLACWELKVERGVLMGIVLALCCHGHGQIGVFSHGYGGQCIEVSGLLDGEQWMEGCASGSGSVSSSITDA
jgi:hypothetical protein